MSYRQPCLLIENPLSNILIQSRARGNFAQERENSKDKNNYWPIALTSRVWKTMERLINDHLVCFFGILYTRHRKPKMLPQNKKYNGSPSAFKKNSKRRISKLETGGV